VGEGSVGECAGDLLRPSVSAPGGTTRRTELAPLA